MSDDDNADTLPPPLPLDVSALITDAYVARLNEMAERGEQAAQTLQAHLAQAPKQGEDEDGDDDQI